MLHLIISQYTIISIKEVLSLLQRARRGVLQGKRHHHSTLRNNSRARSHAGDHRFKLGLVPRRGGGRAQYV